ncbi:hypothetical protein FHR81_001824 [Actinoalloteichus hoggarensis]|uniref:Uncharacterized protein n=1 Tax=Actinoalloteichus hoggarensis TaxID=1470176 RepID=A0A221W4S3_9PSEU|nr:hypothetical protein [Actinoalloteichus hoggarensis]ASO20855.1 hypothetical protein AHOG_16145 [Actinoalloteichus hoggarensis]MBB5920786.1 hypothetical protein [Actinoalloteichus hoggarensis]
MSLARLVTAGLLAAAMLIAPTPAPGAAQTCTTETGVVVVVDFGALGGTVSRCVPGTPDTGYAALQEAGFRLAGTAHDGAGFICRIDDRPGPEQEPCDDTPSGNAYWSYWIDEGGSGWSYSTRGALASYPTADRVEGWSFGAGEPPGMTAAAARARFAAGGDDGAPNPGDPAPPAAPGDPAPGGAADQPRQPAPPPDGRPAPTDVESGRGAPDSGGPEDTDGEGPSGAESTPAAEGASGRDPAGAAEGTEQTAQEAAETGGVPWATIIAFAAIWVLGIGAGIIARRRRAAE